VDAKGDVGTVAPEAPEAPEALGENSEDAEVRRVEVPAAVGPPEAVEFPVGYGALLTEVPFEGALDMTGPVLVVAVGGLPLVAFDMGLETAEIEGPPLLERVENAALAADVPVVRLETLKDPVPVGPIGEVELERGYGAEVDGMTTPEDEAATPVPELGVTVFACGPVLVDAVDGPVTELKLVGVMVFPDGIPVGPAVDV
jgi:hypothetical protein